MPVTRHGTERPREPSLQLCIDFEQTMCRIVGTLRSFDASRGGAVVEIPTFVCLESNPSRETGDGAWFGWGARGRKSGGGLRRYPQYGWYSYVERISIRVLDCEAYKPRRDESRLKCSGGSAWEGRRSKDNRSS